MWNFLFVCLTLFALLGSPLPNSYLNYTSTLITNPTCPVGTYLLHNTCKPCVAGSASSKIGATSITTCLLCPAGKWSKVGASNCANCLAATYNPVIGATTCTSAFTKKLNFIGRVEL